MISKEEIVEKVGVLLKELTEKFEYISDPDKDVNPLEFQLFEINAAYFAEHANLLRKLEEEYNKTGAELEEREEVHKMEVEPIVFTPASTSGHVEEEALDSQETVEEIEKEDSEETVE